MLRPALHWNKEEIGMLSLIAQMLTTFLLKKREADQNEQVMVQLNAILDMQDSYIYAIRKIPMNCCI